MFKIPIQKVLIITILLCSSLLLTAQTQKESLARAAAKGKYWIGIEMGFGGDEGLDTIPTRELYIPLRPSLNFNYFIANRLALIGSFRTGITYLNENKPERPIYSTSHIGGSLAVRYFPIKAVGFFNEIEYQHLKTQLNSSEQQFSGQLTTLGVDVGWAWFVGKKKNAILEVQLRTIGLRFNSEEIFDPTSPYIFNIGYRHLLPSKNRVYSP